MSPNGPSRAGARACGRGARAGICAIVAAVGLFGAAAASATSGPDAVALLNVQRAANGIPGNLIEDPQLSEGCLEYDHYRALNPSEPPHQETAGHAGYTPLGASAHGEVNAFSDNWTSTANPWDTAPIHQSLMFDPAASTAGYAFSEGTACMRFDNGGLMPAPPAPAPAPAPAFYSFVNDAGPGAVTFSETVSEAPYVPQQLVGIAAGTPTGPNLLAFASGFGNAHVAGVGLTVLGGGPVADVRFVDSTTSGVSGFFRNAADIIPARPLEPGTAYTATVDWRNDTGQTGRQTISFTTALRENHVTVRAEVGAPGATAGDQNAPVRISVVSDAPQPALAVSGPTQLRPSISGGEVVVNLAPGRWVACAVSGGPGTGYKPAGNCASFVVTGSPGLTLSPQLVRRPGTQYAVLTASRAAGRHATIVTRYLPGRCRIRRCPANHVARSTTRTIVLHVRQKVPVGILRSGDRVTVTVTTPAFTLAGAPYAAGRVTRSYR